MEHLVSSGTEVFVNRPIGGGEVELVELFISQHNSIWFVPISGQAIDFP